MMSLTDKMQEQGGNPSGLLGTLIGKLMNMFHRNIHQWGLQNFALNETTLCLDIGCGGGNAIKTIAKKVKQGKIVGLDHSREMVELSRKSNSFFIAKGLVEINRGSVSALPYASGQFDLVTAFETIQFWPDLQHDLKEVKRVLKSSGTFLIVNRFPPEDSKWSEFLQIKNSNEYNRLLKSVGFDNIHIDNTTKKSWICVSASIEADKTIK